MTDIKQKLLNYIQQEVVIDSTRQALSVDENLLTTDTLDSLGVMRVVEFIHREFGVDVPPQDITLSHFISVDAMGEYLLARQESSNQPKF